MAKPAFAVTGVFSIFLALIQLALPLYTMQVYDRVLGSRSMETLVMLSLLAVGCFIVFGLLDAIRAQVYLAIGHFTAKTLSIEALETSMRGLLRGGQNRPSQVLRDFSEFRQFLSGPWIAVPFDADTQPDLHCHSLYHPSDLRHRRLRQRPGFGGDQRARPGGDRVDGSGSRPALIRSAGEIDAASKRSRSSRPWA